jgi:hypothetical protein
MSIVINCGFARAFTWHTKTLAKNAISAESGDSKTAFNNRIQNERYKIYMDHFQDFPAFHMDRGMKG